MTIVFLKINLFQINYYFIVYTLVSKLLANLQSIANFMGSVYHVLTYKSFYVLRICSLKKLLILTTYIYIYIYIYIERERERERERKRER